MPQLKLLMILSASLILVSCAQVEKYVTNTEYVDRIIDPAQPIAPISMRDVKFKVVTSDNITSFVDEFKRKNGQLVFIAMSVEGYEKLALNLADLKKYIQQQKSVIVYYEEAIIPKKTEKNDVQ